MNMHTQEWTLVWLNAGLMGLAVFLVSRRPQPGPLPIRLVGATVGFGASGFMLSTLPRLLDWPRGVELTLDTMAFVPFVAALVTAVRVWMQYDRSRRTGRQR